MLSVSKLHKDLIIKHWQVTLSPHLVLTPYFNRVKQIFCIFCSSVIILLSHTVPAMLLLLCTFTTLASSPLKNQRPHKFFLMGHCSLHLGGILYWTCFDLAGSDYFGSSLWGSFFFSPTVLRSSWKCKMSFVKSIWFAYLASACELSCHFQFTSFICFFSLY